VIDVEPERFAELVGTALDSIPSELAKYMDNVGVYVEDDAPPGRLYGLYEGIPLTARSGGYGVGAVMPDRITIFRQTICAHSHTEEELVQRVRVTVIHEVAHHFGISDDRLDELGWS
jgi:predicted Zn-dependent protease with MMP-like domain